MNKIFSKKNTIAFTGILMAMAVFGSGLVFSAEAEAKTKTKISVSAAKEKALKDAGLSASKVTFTKEKYKYDDGERYYDVEFYTDSKKYEYEIDAKTGKVLEKEVEKRKIPKTKKAYIGIDKAKKIALKHAGVSSKVSYTKAKLDKDDDGDVYEVEFYVGRMEYEYSIDAYTGKIVEFDSEYDD